MYLRFGFELEGFYIDRGLGVALPPSSYPVDGFPGLAEVRTVGGKNLDEAYFDLLNEYRKYPFNTNLFEHTFSTTQKRLIRKRQSVKESIDISNVYGKEPKQLGNKTIASLQINISNQVYAGGQFVVDSKLRTEAPRFGIFDYMPIIKALDEEFKAEIKAANRQPGFYAIKDGCRVEYRSLPNTVFKTGLDDVTELLARIKKATTA